MKKEVSTADDRVARLWKNMFPVDIVDFFFFSDLPLIWQKLNIKIFEASILSSFFSFILILLLLNVLLSNPSLLIWPIAILVFKSFFLKRHQVDSYKENKQKICDFRVRSWKTHQ